MHTAMMVANGLLLLLVAGLLGRRVDGAAGVATAVKLFLGFWLLVALGNMWVGVVHAGFTVMQELPFLLAVFGVPAAVAGLVWWRFGRG